MVRPRRLEAAFEENDESSSGDEGEEEDPGPPPESTSDTEPGEPSTAIPTPKEAALVLVQRFDALLRAGQHSSGSCYQLAVHSGWMSDRAPPPPPPPTRATQPR